MKKIKLLTILIVVVIIKSCTPDDGKPRPTRGENSFSVKLNGKQFIAEDVEKFSNTTYGISAYENNEIWKLTFQNSSSQTIYIYLHEITTKGFYEIGMADDNLSFFDNEDTETSVFIGSNSLEVLYHSISPDLEERIEITQLKGDSIIIGQFEKITLSDPNNPNNKTVLTDGHFNINRSTLNDRDDL